MLQKSGKLFCFHSLFSSTSGGACKFISSRKNDVQSLSNLHMDITLPEISSFAVSFENLEPHKRLFCGLKVFA